MHAHVFVPGPELVQVALGSHPPLFVAHELIAAHVIPLPVYPGLHAQVTVSGPVDVHWAVAAHPPLLTAHPLIPMHVIPLPV